MKKVTGFILFLVFCGLLACDGKSSNLQESGLQVGKACGVDFQPQCQGKTLWTCGTSSHQLVKSVCSEQCLTAEDSPTQVAMCGLKSQGESKLIRIMAANITSGNAQAYEGPGIRQFQAMKPDIALVQEFNYKGGTREQLVNEAFGSGYVFYSGAGSIPNAIVSRFPILESGEWESNVVHNRGWTWAVIDIPGPRDLLAVSLHLNTGKHNKEMNPLAAKIAAKQAQGNYYVVMGGDFNTKSRKLTVERFRNVVDTSGPYPADQKGNGNTNNKRSKPYDWLLVDADLRSFEVPVVVGTQQFTDGLVIDSRVHDPLSDIAPVRHGDSQAKNMQHMAVVREFKIKW